MKLSIVIPSFNQGGFLPATLESVMAQKGVSRDELEVIVIDGGSTDGSVEVIQQHADRIDYWVSEKDRGQTHALIKGFSVATGEILGWLCSDDLLEPWTVRQVLDYFATNPDASFVFGDAKWIDVSGRTVKPKKEIPFNWFVWLHDYNYIPQPATFWRRELHDQTGGLNEEFQLAMDGDLWARFALLTRPRHVRRQWAAMRLYPEQKNQRLRARSDYEDRLTRERLGVSYESKSRTFFLYACAKGLRVAWKLTTLRYW